MQAYLKKCLLLLLPLVAFCFHAEAQATYKMSAGEFTVAGTSSLHDWTMTSKDAKGEAVVGIENNVLQDVTKLTVTVKSETLKSGKSGMDSNAYKALDTKKHPEIAFALKSIKSITKSGDHYIVNAEGTLTIAGQARTMAVQAKAYPQGNQIKFTGSKAFKMSDFKITPPTALMGTVKTGDEITINFDLTFKN